MFAISCKLSALYLEQERRLKHKIFGRLFIALPSLEELDRMAGRCAVAGVAAFTFSLACGAYLARMTSALDPAWLVRPKILAALITWLVFAAALALRAVRKRGGKTSACILISGFVAVLATLALSHPWIGEPARPPERREEGTGIGLSPNTKSATASATPAGDTAAGPVRQEGRQ
jgi:ABC-type transport system involved in cytochrome c biogenesis permease subunit